MTLADGPSSAIPAGPDAPGLRPGHLRGPINRKLLGVGLALRGDGVSVGALVDRLGPEGFGLTFLLLALPTLIPVPGPIGLTFGAVLALLSLQVMAGARTVWLPEVIRRRPAPAAALRAVIARALPWIARAEPVLRERRLPALAGRRVRAALALPLFLLALAIMLPIPFGNVAPAIALIVFAVGWIARDGLAILVALALSAAALLWTGFLFVASASLLDSGLAHLGW